MLPKQGNDEADTAAGKGADSHSDGLLSFARWAKKRQDKYVKAMETIHKVMVTVLREARRRMDELKTIQKIVEGNKSKQEMQEIRNAMTEAKWENSKKLEFKKPARGTHRFQAEQRRLDDIHDFLDSMEWQVAPHHSQMA